MKKSEIRQEILKKRRVIDVTARAISAENAAQLLRDTDLFHQSQHIACYLAFPDEFDCMPIIQEIWQADKKCYLPMITGENENSLQFAAYLPSTTLHPNRYQIPEPVAEPIIELHHLDMIIMPLVGFDMRGNRLGMGAGYYDRALSSFHTHQKKSFLLGLAYEIQQVESLPEDEWDIPLNGVLTEQRLQRF